VKFAKIANNVTYFCPFSAYICPECLAVHNKLDDRARHCICIPLLGLIPIDNIPDRTHIGRFNIFVL
jgi:hypothetical protein